MVVNAESSKPSVNERLARAREEDLRRCRNIQAKLARAQQDGEEHPRKQSLSDHAPSPSARRTGLLFLSSTELAKRESDQRSRERQLKRQVAGPIPPQSWRDDFDRLSIRRGVAFDRQRLQDLGLSKGDDIDGGRDKSDDRQARRRDHARVCAGLRFCLEQGNDERLSLRDMTLRIIADGLNRPSSGKAGKNKDKELGPEMDRSQLREVLDYLPKHMQERMLALCGRLAATDWPLSEWTAQALIEVDNRTLTDHKQSETTKEAEDDWENSIDTNPHPITLPKHQSTTLDLAFSHLSPRTITRLLSTPTYLAVSLTTLNLAGFPTSSSSPLDSPSMHTNFASLPNLRVLSLAGSSLSREGGMRDSQRAAVFLRKLSRSLTKLEMLDLSFCNWVSAEAVLAVSWATQGTVSWPRLTRLVLVGCEAVSDPRARVEGDIEAGGSYVAHWHATHSQRSNADGLYDAYADTTHRDPFDLFSAPVQRASARAGFGDYVNGAIQPAIITHMAPSDDNRKEGGGTLIEYVRCPRSSGQIEMWQW